jgi:glucuronate isomerase
VSPAAADLRRQRARILPIWTNSILIGFSRRSRRRERSHEPLRLVKDLPIISPHGHTDPEMVRDNSPFADPASLLLTPDHYVFRMLYSQGIKLEEFGVARVDGGATERDSRKIWRLFAAHYYLFRGTPSRMWFDWVLSSIFDAPIPLTPENADATYDRIAERCRSPSSGRARCSSDSTSKRWPPPSRRSTTSRIHVSIRKSGWRGRVITAYRPITWSIRTRSASSTTSRVQRDHRRRRAVLARLSRRASQAPRVLRRHGRDLHGPRPSDRAHRGPAPADAEALFDRIVEGRAKPGDADLFRGQMLTEMARMSLDDGSCCRSIRALAQSQRAAVRPLRRERRRGHSRRAPTTSARCVRCSIASATIRAFHHRLHARREQLRARARAARRALSGAQARAGLVVPRQPEGMMRFREQTTETAGFYNTVGFNDDTRAFLSIPSRHDVARRVDCSFLARLVAEHRLPEDEAALLAPQLAYEFPKKAYKL